jgi:glycosyltransferase involved in cell wall biosynthesis
VNGRDYKTFLESVEGVSRQVIVVARKHNLEGLAVPRNVRPFFNIPLEELDKLTSMCDFTVFTFDGTELSCGQTSIVTSLMLGKPVICTYCTGTSDYVTNGVNGLVVEMGNAVDLRDKILKLCRERQLYERLSAGALEWVQKYADPDAIQEYTDNIVSRLVASKYGAIKE